MRMIFSRLIRRIGEKWFNVQKQTSLSVQLMQIAVFRGGVIAISSIVVVWISIFLYTAFYYAYMPSMLHMRPVHLEFESCKTEKGICSYPSAKVQLTKKQQLLMVGQPYKVNLHLEMPESSANKELGMFMVCAKLLSRDGYLVDNACRPTMLHYRSELLHVLTTFTFSPMMIFGSREEKQNIVLELFANFEEDRSHPVTSVFVQIKSQHIEFYSAAIGIHAHLSGLRYLMFHWPILSAIVGISTNLFFIALVCILSYLHFAHEDDLQIEQFGYERGETEDTFNKNTNDYPEDSSSSQDTSTFENISKSSDNPAELSDLVPTKSRFIEELKSFEDEAAANMEQIE